MTNIYSKVGNDRFQGDLCDQSAIYFIFAVLDHFVLPNVHIWVKTNNIKYQISDNIGSYKLTEILQADQSF